MSVSSIVGVGRSTMPVVSPRSTETAPPPTREREQNSLVQVDEVTNQPIPPRYPWLSRLSRELEPVSKQPSPYGTVELLGEQLDKQA